MKNILFFLLSLCFVQVSSGQSQSSKKIDSILPVRGLAIEAPSVQGLERFIGFIENDLAPAHFNLLILRVDWNYAYESHPELRNSNPLSKANVKRIVEVSDLQTHKLRINKF